MSNRPAAATVAQLDNHLTYIVYAGDNVDDLHVFFDGLPILTGSIESITVDIVAPTGSSEGQLTAILVRYETGPDGSRRQSSLSLFPGSVEILAKGKRISLSCVEAGAFDGLYLGVGMREDGTSDQLTGVRSLRIVLAAGLASAKLVWNDDGTEEVIF